MKWAGYKQVRLASIKMDVADIRKRSKSAHIADLAQNVRDSGEELINAPTVRASDKRLLCGRDRMAAMTVLKIKKLWVRLVDCDDDEALELEAWENVYRRPIENRAQVLAALVASKEQRIRDAASGDTVPPAQRVKAEARKQVARAAGITPASVKKAEQRAKDSAAVAGTSLQREPAASAAEPALLPEPTLDLLGCDDSGTRAVMGFALKDQGAIDDADKHLRLAQTALTRMAPSDVAQELRTQVHRVASLLRSARPESICPWCKGLPKGEFFTCLPCAGAGYVPKEKKDRAEAKLTNASAPMVAIDGKLYPYADVRDGKIAVVAKPTKNGYVGGVCGKCGKPNGTSDRRPCEKCLGGPGHKKAEKRISVELPDGRTVDAEQEADADQAY